MGALANTRDFNFIQLNRSRRKEKERKKEEDLGSHDGEEEFTIKAYILDKVLLSGRPCTCRWMVRWGGKSGDNSGGDERYRLYNFINVCTVSDEAKVSSRRSSCWWSVQCQVQLLRCQAEDRALVETGWEVQALQVHYIGASSSSIWLSESLGCTDHEWPLLIFSGRSDVLHFVFVITYGD